QVGAVAGRIDAGRGGAGDAVDLDVAAGLLLDARALQPEPVGVGHGPHAHEGVRAGDGPAVAHPDDDAVLVVLHGVGPGVLGQGDAPLAERLLEHERGVGVLVRQDAVPTGDHGDLDAHLG